MTTVGTQAPTGGYAASSLVSVGGYLYASPGNSSGTYTTIVRMSKTTGTGGAVATGLTGITGTASDGTQLFLAGTAVKTIT
ncbi:hypothetical protein AB0M46_04575 [Dactylosporangium sp. NPDC051485]|uniref:hypothetical protein n=1 Tax=Dactylosporangium sp. NPDC051485 TaxID=3154846 RepID=UPI003419E31C